MRLRSVTRLTVASLCRQHQTRQFSFGFGYNPFTNTWGWGYGMGENSVINWHNVIDIAPFGDKRETTQPPKTKELEDRNRAKPDKKSDKKPSKTDKKTDKKQ